MSGEGKASGKAGTVGQTSLFLCFNKHALSAFLGLSLSGTG